MADDVPYDETGAMGGVFAPAFLRGDPRSEEAVKRWYKEHYGVSDREIEESRMPMGFNTGNPAGMVDPEALKVAAQGGKYDMQARRNAIAAQLARANANVAGLAGNRSPGQVPIIGNNPPNVGENPYAGFGFGASGAYLTPSLQPIPANWLNSNVPFAQS